MGYCPFSLCVESRYSRLYRDTGRIVGAHGQAGHNHDMAGHGHDMVQLGPLYDALCMRSCRFLVCRTEVGERSTTGPEMVRTTSEIMDLNREASSHGLELVEEFETGDHIFLKVIPKRLVVRFGKQGELSPRYIGPFEILERVSAVVYWLVLSPRVSGVQEVFHVSMLRRYTPHPTRVLDWGELIVDAERDLRGGTWACLR